MKQARESIHATDALRNGAVQAMTPEPTLNDIPREHLIDMLKDATWYSGGRNFAGKSGYSYEVDEETCYRDVNYRGAELHPTVEQAIISFWKKFYQPKP